MAAPHPARPKWLSRHRFEATLLTALACHVGLLSLTAEVQQRPASSAPPHLEVDVLIEELDPEHAAPEPPRSSDSALRAASDRAPAPAGTPAALARADALDASAEATPTAMPADLPAPAATEVPTRPPARKAVRLLLGSKDLAEMARRRESVPPPAEAHTASVGLLSEGLAELDAEKGLARSSAAISACYRAADLGPDVGTAVLEVRTDARGAVTGVRVIGNDTTGSWLLVADSLLARLKEQLLRVPAGARGLVTRLRVDRGHLAEDLAERGRTKRGVAIGQDHHPKDYGWDESTQVGTSRGRLSPSVGVSSESLRKAIKTRVVLLSEQPL